MKSKNVLYRLAIVFWPVSKLLNWIGNVPLLGRLLRPLFGAEGNRSVIIPVNEAVRGTESVVLPFTLLPALIEHASHRFLLNECMCRAGQRCRNYPREIGCIYLGDGAAQIDPARGRLVEKDEAVEHVRLALRAGLVPLIVHTAFDTFILGVPFRHTLAVCFCCDCCCTVRQTLRLGPQVFWETMQRLPGLRVQVGDGCHGCGACLPLCYVHAIRLADGRAEIDLSRCKGCGRCAAACPADAIELTLDQDVDVMARLMKLVGERTEIGASDSHQAI